MTKGEFVKAIAKKSGETQKTIDEILSAYQEVVLETLKSGETIKLVGFGNYEVSETKDRIGRNPQTGEEMTIKGRKTPKFKFSKTAKDEIAK